MTITLDWYHVILIAVLLHVVYRWGYGSGLRTMRYTLEAAQERLNHYEAVANSLDEPYHALDQPTR